MTDLRLFFQRAHAVAFHGTVHRISLSRYRQSMVSMRGAWLYGARYNIRHYFGCLYTSLEATTAAAEMARYFPIPPDCGFAAAAIELRLSRVVDLTEEKLLRKARVTRTDLTAVDHLVCQEFGLRAWESGVEALLVPSAAIPGAKNLAVFLDNQQPRWSVHLREAKVPG